VWVRVCLWLCGSGLFRERLHFTIATHSVSKPKVFWGAPGYLEVNSPYFSSSTSLFECGSRVTKGNHRVLRLNILEWASAMASSTAWPLREVTEIFQINKANKLLQEDVHIYMIYNAGSWPIEAEGTQWTSSKPEATQALELPPRV
jgi:hypothetical protein